MLHLRGKSRRPPRWRLGGTAPSGASAGLGAGPTLRGRWLRWALHQRMKTTLMPRGRWLCWALVAGRTHPRRGRTGNGSRIWTSTFKMCTLTFTTVVSWRSSSRASRKPSHSALPLSSLLSFSAGSTGANFSRATTKSPATPCRTTCGTRSRSQHSWTAWSSSGSFSASSTGSGRPCPSSPRSRWPLRCGGSSRRSWAFLCASSRPLNGTLWCRS
mmetsp:Transcript_7869/g.22381  ORF Transcript_7869/g.22381 Transcript_7869/m.22381 type:complete len:215 (+) Transcript_7869:44-688(+)